MDQPGKPDADAGADLQNPATARYRCGQCRQQPAHFDLAGELETSSGGSFVRGQNAAGKLLALGHKEHNAGYRGAGSMVLPMACPIRRSSQLSAPGSHSCTHASITCRHSSAVLTAARPPACRIAARTFCGPPAPPLVFACLSQSCRDGPERPSSPGLVPLRDPACLDPRARSSRHQFRGPVTDRKRHLQPACAPEPPLSARALFRAVNQRRQHRSRCSVRLPLAGTSTAIGSQSRSGCCLSRASAGQEVLRGTLPPGAADGACRRLCGVPYRRPCGNRDWAGLTGRLSWVSRPTCGVPV